MAQNTPRPPPHSERSPLIPNAAPSSSSSAFTTPYHSPPLSPSLHARDYGSARPAPLQRVAPLKDSLSTARFVLVCVGIWSANFAFAFQSTAIPTLAPSIGSGFNHAELASYLGSVFTLASTAVIPIYGVFMETLGRRFAMICAAFFFGLGTVFCALAPSMWALIASRAFAGLGGGGLLTVSSVIVTDLVPLVDRGFYQGIMMSVFGAGSMIGGPVCGWLNDAYGWQWAFWAMIPVMGVCVVLVLLLLPEAPIAPTHPSLLSGLASLDWVGTVLLISSVTSLLIGFSCHTSYLVPWSDPKVWGLLLASVLTMGTFVWVETIVKRPLVPLRLLKSRHRAAVLASGFFLSVASQAFGYLVPMYFVVVCNFSTTTAGSISATCGGLGLAVGSMLAGQHIRRGGQYRMLGLLSLAPTIVAAWTAVLWTPRWPIWAYYLTIFPSSLGYSVFLCCNLVALISAVDSHNMPRATALLYTVRTLGVTIGVSLGGSIQLGALTAQLKQRLADQPDKDTIISSILHSKSAIRLLLPDLRERALQAYGWSIATVWIISGGIAVLTMVSAWFIKEKEIGGGKEANAKVGKVVGGVVGELGEGLGQGTIERDRQVSA